MLWCADDVDVHTEGTGSAMEQTKMFKSTSFDAVSQNHLAELKHI